MIPLQHLTHNSSLLQNLRKLIIVGAQELRKNWGSHIDASHSRQPLVKGERLVRHEVNAVMLTGQLFHPIIFFVYFEVIRIVLLYQSP